jgi:hypothetical protein
VATSRAEAETISITTVFSYLPYFCYMYINGDLACIQWIQCCLPPIEGAGAGSLPVPYPGGAKNKLNGVVCILDSFYN